MKRPYICKHDQLGRCCNICDLEEYVEELKLENDMLKALANKGAGILIKDAWVMESMKQGYYDFKLDIEIVIEELEKESTRHRENANKMLTTSPAYFAAHSMADVIDYAIEKLKPLIPTHTE